MSQPTLSLGGIAIALPTLLIAYIVLKIVYNVLLHPLRSYPGPVTCRASILPFHKASLAGTVHLWLHELHTKYGPVVRFAPDQLSYIEHSAWKDIYGHKGAVVFRKPYWFYGPEAFGDGTEPGLIRAGDVSHARQRRLVSHAFSDKALHEQQGLLNRYVDLLISRLRDVAEAGASTNMVDWYNFTTFDIMADLTFGEPLKLLEGSAYTPWVRALFSYMRVINLGSNVRLWPVLERLLFKLASKQTVARRKLHMEHAIKRVDKRLAQKTERPDIWTYILRYSESEENKEKVLTPSEMYSNAALFMLAGTETTATELSGLTYHLLKNPDRLQKLQKEIRGAFSLSDTMTMTALSQLPYLNACIDEGLRIYPPLGGTIPRLVSKAGATVQGKSIPEGMSVSMVQYAAYHSELNFKNPDAYIPERWLPEGQAEYGADHKEVLLPFSTGPRNCVGKNLATHELRLVLASVIRNFDMELCAESENWPDQKIFIIWEKGPLMVRLTPVQA